MDIRYLVFDKRIIESTANAKLSVTEAEKHSSNPLFGEDNPWEKRYDNLYANVLYDGRISCTKAGTVLLSSINLLVG